MAEESMTSEDMKELFREWTQGMEIEDQPKLSLKEKQEYMSEMFLITRERIRRENKHLKG